MGVEWLLSSIMASDNSTNSNFFIVFLGSVSHRLAFKLPNVEEATLHQWLLHSRMALGSQAHRPVLFQGNDFATPLWEETMITSSNGLVIDHEDALGLLSATMKQGQHKRVIVMCHGGPFHASLKGVNGKVLQLLKGAIDRTGGFCADVGTWTMAVRFLDTPGVPVPLELIELAARLILWVFEESGASESPVFYGQDEEQEESDGEECCLSLETALEFYSIFAQGRTKPEANSDHSSTEVSPVEQSGRALIGSEESEERAEELDGSVQFLSDTESISDSEREEGGPRLEAIPEEDPIRRLLQTVPVRRQDFKTWIQVMKSDPDVRFPPLHNILNSEGFQHAFSLGLTSRITNNALMQWLSCAYIISAACHGELLAREPEASVGIRDIYQHLVTLDDSLMQVETTFSLHAQILVVDDSFMTELHSWSMVISSGGYANTIFKTILDKMRIRKGENREADFRARYFAQNIKHI